MEVIIFIVIVSTALAGVLVSLNHSAKHSADPLLAKQALAVAEGLLEEITLKEYSDPDGVGEGTDRDKYDDILDFVTALGTPKVIDKDIFGNDYPKGFKPVVTITATKLGPVAVNNAYEIEVSVSYTHGTITLTGYRANY